MSKTQTVEGERPQDVSLLAIEALKQAYRWRMGALALMAAIVGVIAGYFLSLNIITDTQFKAVEVVRSLQQQ